LRLMALCARAANGSSNIAPQQNQKLNFVKRMPPGFLMPQKLVSIAARRYDDGFVSV